MPSSFSLLVALVVLPQAALGNAKNSLRTVVNERVSEKRTVESKPCSCDCCSVEQEDQAVGNSLGAHKCAPRSGSFASAESGCSDICMLPEGLKKAFLSEKGDADYSRYCMAECSPVGSKLHDMCVDSSLIEVEKPAPPAPKKVKAMAQTSSEVTSGAAAASESALVLLAKQKMQEAELQAEAAGRAAFTSRTAYERLKLTSDEMALQAAQTTMDEIKAEAGQQAKKALNVRLAYEKNAQDTAIKNAVGAAGVYSKAMVRDMANSAVWQERAGQFATAANQREKMAMDFSEEAETYRARNEFPASKQRLVMAHQAMDQAAAFGAQSEAAHKQAQAIANSKPWYLYAKRAIAGFILAKSMPHDVAPPLMPALP